MAVVCGAKLVGRRARGFFEKAAGCLGRAQLGVPPRRDGFDWYAHCASLPVVDCAPDALMRVFEFALILAPEQEFGFRFFAEKVNPYEDFAESIDLAYLHLDRTCRILDFALIVRRSFNEKV